MKTHTFFIEGQVVSQKNDKQVAFNRATGKPFIMSNKRVQDWKKIAQTYLYGVPHFTGKVVIEMTFFNKDKRPRDLDNMTTSILDLLKNNLIIEDDNCFVVESIFSKFGGIDKNHCGVEIIIKSLDT